MTELQIYLLIAPIVAAVVLAGGALWWSKHL
jgi:hypothetical protein